METQKIEEQKENREENIKQENIFFQDNKIQIQDIELRKKVISLITRISNYNKKYKKQLEELLEDKCVVQVIMRIDPK